MGWTSTQDNFTCPKKALSFLNLDFLGTKFINMLDYTSLVKIKLKPWTQVLCANFICYSNSCTHLLIDRDTVTEGLQRGPREGLPTPVFWPGNSMDSMGLRRVGHNWVNFAFTFMWTEVSCLGILLIGEFHQLVNGLSSLNPLICFLK